MNLLSTSPYQSFREHELSGVYPGVGLLGQRASLFTEEYIFIVALSSFHCHFLWLPLGCLHLYYLILSSPNPGDAGRANILSKYYYHPDVELPPAGVQGSSSEGLKAPERRGKLRTLRLQNCFLWEMAAEFQKKSHTLLDQNLLGAASKKEAGKGGRVSWALGRRRGLYKFHVTLFLLLRLDNGIAVMFLIKNSYLLEICTQELVDKTGSISGFALKALGGQGHRQTPWPSLHSC